MNGTYVCVPICLSVCTVCLKYLEYTEYIMNYAPDYTLLCIIVVLYKFFYISFEVTSLWLGQSYDMKNKHK